MANAEPEPKPSKRALKPRDGNGTTSSAAARSGAPRGAEPQPARSVLDGAPVDSPFQRVLSIGDRHTAVLLAVALGASTLVHSGFALASHVREMNVTPTQPSCRAGETIQLEAFARPALGSTLRVTHSAQWSVPAEAPASHAGGGLFRCVSEGTATITAAYLNRTATVTLRVDPALVMVDVEEEKKEEPPPPPPEPEPEPAPAPPAQSPVAPPEAKATPEPPPPAAAKAGNLLTAPDDTKTDPADEPYSFVTDPNGNEYGSGTVAKGGTEDFGKAGAVASGVPGGTGTGVATKGPPTPPPPPQAKVDLSRKPALAAGDGCGKSYFPADADDDVGMVQVLVTVKPSGEVASVSVMSENPKGQGFGKAARSCLLTKKFVPGLDADGKPVQTTTPVNIRFTR